MVRCSGGELISLCTADMLPILNAIFHLIMVYEWKATYIYISNSSKCGCYSPVTHAEGLTATTLM